MSNRAELLKSLIKGNTDISEDASLDKYLLSRGINPKFATKDQKVAHSKTGQFIKWKNDHMRDLGEGLTITHTPAGKKAHALKKSVHYNQEIRTGDGHEKLHSEAVDKKDMVCFDIPLLIRVLEFTREEMKTDIELHNMVERLINMRHDVPLDMSHYDEITQKLVKENHIAIAMGKMLDDEGSMVLNQLDDIDRCSKMIRDYVGKDYEKQLPAWVQSKVTLAADYINTVGTYLMSKNEETSHDPWKDKHFGPTKVVKQKYHVKTDTKSYNVKADNEEHAHKLVNKHAPGSKIVSIEHKGRIMEEVEQIDEISTDGYYAAAIKNRKQHAVKLMTSMGADKNARTKLNARNAGMKRVEKRTQDEMKRANSGPKLPEPPRKPPTEAEVRGYGQGRYMGDSVEHDESLVEAQSAAIRFQKALQREKEKREQQEKRDAENAKRALAPKPVQEADCGCADVPPEDKNKKLIQMSKSARMIKSIYKKNGMKEETYDHEKEDKSVATYGKKPKMATTSKESSFGEKKPDAAAVLTGGTTLTGQPRDTVEIDPMMRKRPGPDIPGKKN